MSTLRREHTRQGGLVCRRPEMGEDTASRETDKKFSRQNTRAVTRAVTGGTRGWPGAGWQRQTWPGELPLAALGRGDWKNVVADWGSWWHRRGQ